MIIEEIVAGPRVTPPVVPAIWRSSRASGARVVAVTGGSAWLGV
jgi:hypothetical protein